jgi:ATP-binding cassette subfamily B protein
VGLLARDAFAIAIPLLIRKAVTLLADAHDYRGAAWVGAAIVLVAVPKAFLQVFARLRLMYASRDAEYAMRNGLFRHLMSLEPAFFSRMRTGDLMAHATNDLNAVKLMLGPGLVNLFESFVTFPAAIIVMAAVDWRLTLVALSPIPIAVWQMAWFGKRVHKRTEEVQAQFSDLSTLVEQHITGVRSVRAFAQERVEMSRLAVLNDRYFEANRQLGMYASLNDPLLVFVMGLATLAGLWYGGKEVYESHLSLGSFAMFMTYMSTLIRPVSALGRVVILLQRGLASLERLGALFGARPAIASPAAPVRPAKTTGAIRFEDVWVRHGKVDALRSVDLLVPAGARVAIVGQTGSGKSTLARLIPRLVDPSEGRVTVDGVDIRKLALQDLRSHIGFVPQETFLFSATLAENIAWGAPSATEHEIRRAAELAGLEEDIGSFPRGYETIVGERGVLLSGGQKQRVAIARAIVRKPRILIFDDALSSVDSVTEQRILDHLDSVLDNSTTILITHRLSAIRRAARILVLDGGEIVEDGSHERLLAQGGAYLRLWSEHQLEEVAAAT